MLVKRSPAPSVSEDEKAPSAKSPSFGRREVSASISSKNTVALRPRLQPNLILDKEIHSRSVSVPVSESSIIVDQDAVKDLEGADSSKLNQYIDDIEPVSAKEQLKTLVNYNERLDGEMHELNELGQKLQSQGLSDAESARMKALMHCHKYNLSLAQGWLSAVQARGMQTGAMNGQTATILMALSNRLAMRHMDLADTLSLYEDALPDKEPLRRSDRAAYNLLTARASLRAFKSMMLSQKDTNPEAYNRMREIYRPLLRHCKALEHAARLAKGQVKMDAMDPQLEIESLDAWTESFELAAKEADMSVLSQHEIDELSKSWNSNSPKLPLNHPQLPQSKMMQFFIEHQLKKMDVSLTQLPKFEAAYKPSLIIEINKNEWPILDKSLQFEINGEKHACRSTIAPGAHLARRFENPYRNNGVSYMDRQQAEHAPNLAHTQLLADDGEVLFSGVRHGIIDAYDYNDAAVRKFSNAQLTKMAETIYDSVENRHKIDFSTIEQQLQALEETEPDNDETITMASNKGVFGQLSGAPESIKLSLVRKRFLETQVRIREARVRVMVDEIKNDPVKRAEYIREIRNLASHKMARELLSAAIVSDPTKLQAALKGEVVDVTMNSVALVTPDWYRARYMKGGPKDERLMLTHQVQALQSLPHKGPPYSPIKLMIADENGALKEIKVNLKVRAFNFGVNEYALAKAGVPSHFPIWRNLMGWGFSASINNPQLQELLGASNNRELGGAVADRLQMLEQSKDPKVQKKAVLLREAATQAKTIWRNRSFWSGNNEPYKMVSRLTLTSHLMDETPLFNCKSGKDRTGQLDAEVKYLAAVGHATGHIPEPDIAHTNESRKMRTTFTLDAGNMELQRMNTGLPGYKLRNIPGLEAMREKGTKAAYEGGSDLV